MLLISSSDIILTTPTVAIIVNGCMPIKLSAAELSKLSCFWDYLSCSWLQSLPWSPARRSLPMVQVKYLIMPA